MDYFKQGIESPVSNPNYWNIRIGGKEWRYALDARDWLIIKLTAFGSNGLRMHDNDGEDDGHIWIERNGISVGIFIEDNSLESQVPFSRWNETCDCAWWHSAQGIRRCQVWYDNGIGFTWHHWQHDRRVSKTDMFIQDMELLFETMAHQRTGWTMVIQINERLQFIIKSAVIFTESCFLLFKCFIENCIHSVSMIMLAIQKSRWRLVPLIRHCSYMPVMFFEYNFAFKHITG